MRQKIGEKFSGRSSSYSRAPVSLLASRLTLRVGGLGRSDLGRRHHPYAGIGLSVAGMIAAAFGMITPVQGAVFQELIDVAVIGNALRALYDGSAIRAPGLL